MSSDFTATSVQWQFLTVIIGIMIAYFIYSKLIKPKPSSYHALKTRFGDNRLMELNRTKQIQMKLPPNFAMVTDLDHTLIGHTEDETHSDCNQHLREFNELWLKQYAPKNCVLIYATGRNFHKYQLAVSEWDLLKPDILVSGDGVTIHWFNKSLAQQVQAKSTHQIDMTFDDTVDDTEFVWHDKSYDALLSEAWDQEFAQKVHDEVYKKWDLMPLPAGSLSVEPFRIGVLVEGYKRAKEIELYYMLRVKEYNAENKDKPGFQPMMIHSFIAIERNLKKIEGKDDPFWSAFTPAKAGKGSAIEFLRKRLHLSEDGMICMGDSGNDISMLNIDGYNSVIMANASQELLSYYDEKMNDSNNNGEAIKRGSMIKTKKPKTLGVIEGLNFYGPRLLNQQ